MPALFTSKKLRMLQRLCIVAAFACAYIYFAPASKSSEPKPAAEIFNGIDLTGWEGDENYWSVEEGEIVGGSSEHIPENTFLFTEDEYGDFYFVVDVKLTPDEGNSGIQFRSSRDEQGHARGYQADIGAGWWGTLYHEHGRGQLDNTPTGMAEARPGEWNRYEILAVGPHIWTAVNGVVSVAINDPAGELRGRLALQMHSGDPLEVRWKNLQIIEDPPVELCGLGQEELEALLHPPLDAQGE